MVVVVVGAGVTERSTLARSGMVLQEPETWTIAVTSLLTGSMILFPLHSEVYLRGDIQEGGAGSELLPLSEKGKVDLTIEDQELFPDTHGLI